MQLGWAPERVQVVDDDLGQSGSRSGERFGFQEMVSRTALGQIGLILAVEVSRLARSNRDWYHLLDVCAITATLIGDEEALYDPNSYNDTVTPGPQRNDERSGTALIRQRLVEAMRAKARRGELQRKLPPGYHGSNWGACNRTPTNRCAGPWRGCLKVLIEWARFIKPIFTWWKKDRSAGAGSRRQIGLASSDLPTHSSSVNQPGLRRRVCLRAASSGGEFGRGIKTQEAAQGG